MSHSPHRDAASDPHADPCPGRCNRTWRNADRIDPDGNHYDRDGHLIDPTPGQPVWCRPCADAIRAALGSLPDHAVARRDGRTAPGDTTGDRTRHATGGLAAPSPSPAFDELDELEAWARGWVEALADHLRHDAPSLRPRVDGVPARNLTGHVRYLQGHATALLSAPFAVDVGRETLAVAHRLERTAGHDRVRTRLAEPCPTCDVRALVREDGLDYVECRACGRLWSEAEYDRLAVVLTHERAVFAG